MEITTAIYPLSLILILRSFVLVVLLLTLKKTGNHLLQYDRRHWDFKKLLSNGHKGQEPSEEQAENEQDTLQTEEYGNV